MAVEQINSLTAPQETAAHSYRHTIGKIALAAAGISGAALLGTAVGAHVGLETSTHMDIAGVKVSLQPTPGNPVFDVHVDGLAEYLRTSRITYKGEPIGGKAYLDFSQAQFTDGSGHYNTAAITEFFQMFSDPKSTQADIRSAITRHMATNVALGGALGAASAAGALGFMMWRRKRLDKLSDHDQGVVMEWTKPAHRARQAGVVALTGCLVWGGVTDYQQFRPHAAPHLNVTRSLDGTPFAGGELRGVLAPAVNMIGSLARKYISNTNSYYNAVEANQKQAFTQFGNSLQTDDPDTKRVLFVTDRHCNVGEDRNIIQAAQAAKVDIVISGGDDDFSGSYSFEKGCTANLAARLNAIHIPFVAELGNHDSAETAKWETEQGIKVLEGKPITVSGLVIDGVRDPSRSVLFHPITPGGAERTELLTQQAQMVAQTACSSKKHLDIVVLHDPTAGIQALQKGCGNITLELSGHVHELGKPIAITNPDGSTSWMFVGGSAGGAPPEGRHSGIEDGITVGPLQHDATMDVIDIDPKTHAVDWGNSVNIIAHPDTSVEISRVQPPAQVTKAQ